MFSRSLLENLLNNNSFRTRMMLKRNHMVMTKCAREFIISMLFVLLLQSLYIFRIVVIHNCDYVVNLKFINENDTKLKLNVSLLSCIYIV